MRNSWFNCITSKNGIVTPVLGGMGTAALLCQQNDMIALRISENVVTSTKVIDELEIIAKHYKVNRIETQGKFTSEGLAARLLIKRGFSVVGPVSVHFKIEVANARERLIHLQQRLGDCRLQTLDLCSYHIKSIAKVVHEELILDSFEFCARLIHKGLGAIRPEECPVIVDNKGLAGFILTSLVSDPKARELMVRWVAPRHRRAAKVNLALMLDCLSKAAASKVTTAYFSADPHRHNDTMRLACVLQAEKYGESVALGRDLGRDLG